MKSSASFVLGLKIINKKYEILENKKLQTALNLFFVRIGEITTKNRKYTT